LNSTSRHIFYALSSSLLFILSFPGAIGWWPCIWIALVPFFAAVRDQSAGRAFRLGLLVGFCHFTFLLYWIYIVLHTYGYLPWWVAVPAVLLLSLYMSLYPAFFAVIIAGVMRRGGSVLWVAPACWVALDFVRSLLFSGFPWQDLAYSQYRIPLIIQSADLAGHYGITFLIVLVNGLVYTVYTQWGAEKQGQAPAGLKRKRLRWQMLPAGLLIMAAVVYSPIRYAQVADALKQGKTVPVVVVQGNIAQDLKWTQPMQRQTVRIYQQLSAAAAAEFGETKADVLLVWPETALPFYIKDTDRLPRQILRLVRNNTAFLLTGVPYIAASSHMAGAEEEYYNSAILVAPNGAVTGRYNKQHLVPFGEYIPFRKILPLPGPLVESMGDFSAGAGQQPLVCQAARIGVLICFESIFPELARHWVENGANLLVNITNDAWYGRSSAPWQHFSMAVLRAVETRRSLARAANTGVSGFVDPLGRTSGLLPLFQAGYSTARLVLGRESTVFVRFGYMFPILCLAAMLLFGGYSWWFSSRQ
jgi:apolipoprotein N-acyltransferase